MRNPILSLLLVGLCTRGAVLAQYTSAALPQSPPRQGMQAVCPWLTQGTAAAALGGDVSGTVSVSESGEGVCKFARQKSPAGTLEIVVKKAALPSCPQGSTPLRGIGNHAELCRLAGAAHENVQMLSSRVRDQYFTLTLVSHGFEKAKPAELQEQPLENLGEQVAGNLY